MIKLEDGISTLSDNSVVSEGMLYATQKIVPSMLDGIFYTMASYRTVEPYLDALYDESKKSKNLIIRRVASCNVCRYESNGKVMDISRKDDYDTILIETNLTPLLITIQ